MTTAGVGAYRNARVGTGRAGAQARTARFNRNMLKVVGAAVMVSLFVYISRMAVIASGSKTINTLRSEISALESNRQYLEISLSARQNLDRVYDEAVGRLGMSYPDAGRVRVVSLSGDTALSNAQTAYEGGAQSATP